MTKFAFGEVVTYSGESADDTCPQWFVAGVFGVIVGVETRPIAGETPNDPSYYVVSGVHVDSFWREELKHVQRNAFTIALAAILFCGWRVRRGIHRAAFFITRPYRNVRHRILEHKRLKQLRDPWRRR